MDSVCIYIDDILVANETFEEHLFVLEKVFEKNSGSLFESFCEQGNFCKFSLDYVGL
jgi:hypothetical protein